MIPKFVRRFLERRRFPTLMLVGGVLFLANLLVPDPIPFVDEILPPYRPRSRVASRENERKRRRVDEAFSQIIFYCLFSVYFYFSLLLLLDY